MADHTKIEWTDATANVINGCTVLSPGCKHCYAMRLAGTRMRNHPTREGLTVNTKAGPVWTGEVRFNEKALRQVLSWTKPRMIFWNAHGDLFHENVPDAWIDRSFAAMALTPHHTHQVLTKRSRRMREYLSDKDSWLRIIAALDEVKPNRRWNGSVFQAKRAIEARRLLPNVWMGVSVEDQPRADERIPDLLATPAAVRWISAEPLLGPVDLTRLQEGLPINAWLTWLDGLDWVVVGGESGPGARPMHPDWARSLWDQCAAAGVAFLLKQWGEWVEVFDRDREDPDWRRCGDWQYTHPRGQWHNLAGGTGFHGERVIYVDRVGKKAAGRLLDGVLHDGYPAKATAQSEGASS